MPRIQGVDIPPDKPTHISLRYIRGLGPTTALEVCEKLHIDPQRRAPMRVTPVPRTRFAARSLGVLLRPPARERRGLAGRPSTRHLELFFQPLVLAPQSIALDLRAPQVLFESFDPLRLVLDDLLRITRRRIFRAPRHGIVMPDSRGQYKREMRISRALTR